MSKSKLQNLARDIDPASILEDDVIELLLKLSEDFIDNVVSGSCSLAKHRRSQTLDVQDVKLYLNTQWDLQIPGFPVDDTKHKKLAGEAHKQRLALIRKTLKR
jgi:transcription initiation factor TFIID subunit 12